MRKFFFGFQEAMAMGKVRQEYKASNLGTLSFETELTKLIFQYR